MFKREKKGVSKRQKKYSIVIIPDDGSKIRKYAFSQRGVNVLKVVFICIILGVLGLVLEYGNMIEKNLKIKELEEHNKELVERYGKLQTFEEEFAQFKERVFKLANMLGIESKTLSSSANISVNQEEDVSGLSENGSRNPEGLPFLKGTKNWVSRSFSDYHSGMDFSASLGTTVISTMTGVVKFAGWNDTLGNIVNISNEETGYGTVYGHLTKYSVTTGEKISKGNVIGYVGSTGRSTAPHLHYEVWLDGESKDPRLYIGE
jgi:murein DD-endopeptidase MepM/ murein hydrolase activator NlpD